MTNTRQAVWIVGVGARTPVGLTAPSAAAAVRAGIAAFAEHPYMIDSVGEPMMVARVLPAEMPVVQRFCELAVPAAGEALEPVAGLPACSAGIPAFIGLPSPRPGLPAQLAGQWSAGWRNAMPDHPPIGEVQTIAAGHAAGLMALQRGGQTIQQGEADLCLVGGVDSYLQPQTLEWLEACGQLHGAGAQNNAWGFIPGEAAGFCVLAAEPFARRHGLACLGVVLGVATAVEENRIKTNAICLGKGLSEAFFQVISSLPPQAQIQSAIGDMNGEPYRAEEYAFAMARACGFFVDAGDFLAPAEYWGDVGAASGPLFVNLVVAARLRRYSTGPYYLAWAGSESGERGAALIHINADH